MGPHRGGMVSCGSSTAQRVSLKYSYSLVIRWRLARVHSKPQAGSRAWGLGLRTWWPPARGRVKANAAACVPVTHWQRPRVTCSAFLGAYHGQQLLVLLRGHALCHRGGAGDGGRGGGSGVLGRAGPGGGRRGGVRLHQGGGRVLRVGACSRVSRGGESKISEIASKECYG